jgi:hypothetical protein
MIPAGASSAGVMAVGFVTHVFVRADDAEQAAALIAQMRATPGIEDDEEEDDDDRRADLSLTIDRRKKVGGVVLIGVMIQFGTGHMSTGAWGRGFALALLEIAGIIVLSEGNRVGIAMVVAAVVCDVVGGVMRARRLGAPSTLPVAQLRAPRSRDPR